MYYRPRRKRNIDNSHKILPINNNSRIHCYSHHTNSLAVATNSDIKSEYDVIFSNIKHIFRDIDFNRYNSCTINCNPIIKYSNNNIKLILKNDKNESAKNALFMKE